MTKWSVLLTLFLEVSGRNETNAPVEDHSHPVCIDFLANEQVSARRYLQLVFGRCFKIVQDLGRDIEGCYTSVKLQPTFVTFCIAVTYLAPQHKFLAANLASLSPELCHKANRFADLLPGGRR